MAPRDKTRCLVVDDEPKSAEVICKWIKAMGHSFDLASCCEKARKRLKGRTYDYAVVDVKLKVDEKDNDPDSSNGRALLQGICRDHPNLPVLMMTAHAKDPELSAELIKIGAKEFMLKESGSQKFQQKVEAMLSNLGRQGLRGRDPARAARDRKDSARMNTDQVRKSDQRRRNHELVVDENEPNVMILQGKEIGLTKTEFNFMCFMARHPRKRLSTDRIIGAVWRNSSNGGVQDQRIRSVVTDIRQKTKKAFRGFKADKFIQAIRGVGHWMLDMAPAKVSFTAKSAA